MYRQLTSIYKNIYGSQSIRVKESKPKQLNQKR